MHTRWRVLRLQGRAGAERKREHSARAEKLYAKSWKLEPGVGPPRLESFEELDKLPAFFVRELFAVFVALVTVAYDGGVEFECS